MDKAEFLKRLEKPVTVTLPIIGRSRAWDTTNCIGTNTHTKESLKGNKGKRKGKPFEPQLGGNHRWFISRRARSIVRSFRRGNR